MVAKKVAQKENLTVERWVVVMVSLKVEGVVVSMVVMMVDMMDETKVGWTDIDWAELKENMQVGEKAELTDFYVAESMVACWVPD